MKMTCAILLLCSIAPLSMEARAGSGGGAISQMLFMPNGAVLVYLNSPLSGLASCSTAERFAVNANNDVGKAQLAGLLMAHANRRPVQIYGSGQCDAWGDTESVSYFVLP